MKKGNIAIAAFAIAIVMLAMVQSASAAAFSCVGTIKYEDGTTCPYGWTVCMENLNQTYTTEPWCELSANTPPLWNYLVAGEYEAGTDYMKVTVTSPDGSYEGTNTAMWSDAYDPGPDFVIIDVVVHPVALPEFSKELPAGWNLISLPLKPSVNSTSTVLSSVSQDAVYSYNAALNSFVDVSTGTMDPGIGYFVHVTSPSTWTYSGSAYTTMSAGLSEGLNMVGWLNCSKGISDGLSSIAGNYYYAAGWDATSQSYVTYNPAAPDPDNPTGFNDLFDMERGAGYFISAKTVTTLNEGCA